MPCSSLQPEVLKLPETDQTRRRIIQLVAYDEPPTVHIPSMRGGASILTCATT